MHYKVLIVDDSENTLILFEALLKRMENCVSVKFSSAVAGLANAQQEDYDLVIVDYMMPDLNGIDFITRFRQTPGRENTPVLMVTANDQRQVRYRALDAGATDFLTKPVDKIEFMARVNNMLQLGASRKVLVDRAAWLAEEVRKATYQIRERERETVIRLSKATEYRDANTGSHIVRMANYSELIARGLGLAPEQCELLLEAAALHDIGKVGIPDSILLKPARLTSKEFEVMKLHTVYGYDILNGSASQVLQTGAAIALGHHERFDGSGYPAGLKGEAIPIFSRIVAVADVFDALTAQRPYKQSWSAERASAHIQASAGAHFDPRCVATFFSNWENVSRIRRRFQDDDDAVTIL